MEHKYTILVDGIYSYFAAHCGTRKVKHRNRTRQSKSASQLRKAKELKNAARRELAQAKRSDTISQDQIRSIAQKFFTSVRSHNKLKRAHQNFQHRAASTCRTARQQCHENLWHFTRQLLDDKILTDIQPTFSESEATAFFSTVYQSQPRSYARPSWMPAAAAPDTEFCEDDISIDEIASAIKKASSGSSPSPFDGIAYTVFKKCPSLVTALHNTFNLCWVCSSVPSAWKLASIKLISKSSARSDPSSPSNFRPIALTSCVGKLFSTILRNRWLSYMLTNEYFNPPKKHSCQQHQDVRSTT